MLKKTNAHGNFLQLTPGTNKSEKRPHSTWKWEISDKYSDVKLAYIKDCIMFIRPDLIKCVAGCVCDYRCMYMCALLQRLLITYHQLTLQTNKYMWIVTT